MTKVNFYLFIKNPKQTHPISTQSLNI